MKPYEVYPAERRCFEDRGTGLPVWQLTNYKGHSEHPYFTDDGWFDHDRNMLFVSDRDNVRNLFYIDIESGEMFRITDMPRGGPDIRCPMFVNHERNETYYQYNGCVYALRLDTLETRPLYIIPRGFTFGGARPTGDGKYVVAGLVEDLSQTIKSNLTAGYIGFEEIFAAKPDSRIVRINVTDNTVEEVWQEQCWVGHVNPSLTQGNLLTFCHEGPWGKVDHRIWVLDLDTGKARKIRERRFEGEMIGHEYWFLDGIHVGYQAHRPSGGDSSSYFGFVRYDGSGEVEAPCVRVPGPDHIHSVDFNFVVSDTGKTIKGYKYNGKNFDGPRIITMHDGSFDWGAHHPHPAITRDGKSVVYNSTAAGYCNIYMTALPEDFYALPPLELGQQH
ncbi:MAG: oligogalacturonate lyase family protein [Spirochaetaceae bacterium]|jgi:oligogalacturonide lyase|nr:oligogalacturonate lyase family protein [Spirochaetaceae bacterium]